MAVESAAVIVPVEAECEERERRLACLFDAHEDRLYRLARRLAANRDDARDLVQDTFVRAAQSLNSVPTGFSKEEAWLVRVLVNIRRDQWRRTVVRNRFVATLRPDVPNASNVESAVIARQLVWAALNILEPRRRAIVIMHELEGMTASAIAAVVGVRRMTVQWHLSMARRDLKRALTSQLGETP